MLRKRRSEAPARNARHPVSKLLIKYKTMNKKFQKRTLKEKGFSIAEVILSVFILSVGLTAVVALVSSSMRSSFGNRDVIIASQLAQEGVELVRNIRDNDFIQNPSDVFIHFPASDSDCRIDSSYSSGNIDCGSLDFSLKLNNGFFVHGVGTETTKFSRKVYISGTNQRIVTSIVLWDGASSFPSVDGNLGRNCTISTKCSFSQIALTDWRQVSTP